MPPPGAGGGRPSSLDGCPLRHSARGNRPGARTGEGAGIGLETAQQSKIHFKPLPGAGGGSVAGEGVGIGILAERNDIKAPAGSGRGQRMRTGRRREERSDKRCGRARARGRGWGRGCFGPTWSKNKGGRNASPKRSAASKGTARRTPSAQRSH